MNFIEKIIKILLHPTEFFEEIKEEKGILSAFLYLMIISIIPTISSSFLTLFAIPYVETVSIMMVVVYFGILICSFILAIVIHLFVKLFKGEGNFSSTYKVIAYSYTPFFLFSWVLFVNIVIGLYSFYLMIKGLSTIHKISKAKSLIIELISFFVFVVLFFIFEVFLFTYPFQAYSIAEELRDKAIQNKDYTFCEKIHTGYEATRDDCFYKVAKEINDSSLCEKIKTDWFKTNCYFDVAILSNNFELCKETVTKIQDCYYQIAKNTKDSSLCDKLEGNENRTTCMALTKLDISYCESFNQPAEFLEKEECYFELAMITQDYSICEKMLSGHEVSVKAEEVFNEPFRAVGRNVGRENCFVRIAVTTKDYKVCERMKEFIEYKSDTDQCFRLVAKETKNPSLCEKVILEPNKQQCLKDSG